MKRLVLIDAHAIIHRAFHALPPLTSNDGQLVNAVYGFSAILVKMLKDLEPDYVIAAFDHPDQTFRHVAYDRYKATRTKAPDELYQQIPLVKQILSAFGIPLFEQSGYEADDIIGTITREVRKKHLAVEVVIATGDLDTLQLIDEHTMVYTMKKGVSDTAMLDAAYVRERFGLAPRQMVDYKGLRGDPSDNIPGVRGIGEKTASELLQKYGSIEELYKKLKKNEVEAKPGILKALKTYEADALFSKTLATIDTHMPLKFLLAASRMKNVGSKPEIQELFSKLGFESLLKRLAFSAGTHYQPSLVEGPTLVRSHYQSGARLSFPADHIMLLGPIEGIGYVGVGENEVMEVAASDLGSVLESVSSAKKTLYVFDAKPLLRSGVLPKSLIVRDLMIMWWLLDAGRRNYLPETLVQKEFSASPKNPAETAVCLFQVAPRLDARLKTEELELVYETLEGPLTSILIEMEDRGILLDDAPLHALQRDMANSIQKLESSIHAMAGGAFNIHSPRQLAEILFEKLKLEARGIRKTEKSGVLSTKESELRKLQAIHPIIGKILEYRELTKLKSTYVDTLPKMRGPDERIHTTWNQTGTATGRLSSQNPNLQNIPIRSEYGKEIRKSFIASRGFTLVAFDYSQLELRIAASLAEDKKMTEAFRTGVDIHTMTASEINNVPIKEVTPELRQRAKALNFGILYGMGVRAFSESARVSRDEAAHFIEEYFNDFTGIAKFIETTKAFARANGYTKTAFGRKRFFPEILATNFRLQREAERMAVNHPVQGTEADIMKKAMIEIDTFLKKKKIENDVRLLLQIHDELFFEMKKSVVKTAAPVIKRIMEHVWDTNVPMKVEVKQGRTWGELE